jgi:hypothetical protein
MLPGSIIFQVLKDDDPFVNAVSRSYENNDDNVNHVGIVVNNDEVIEADNEKGVVITPFNEFINNANVSIVAEIKDKQLMALAIKNSLKYLGLPYNHSFYINGAGVYCSELVVKSFTYENGEQYFPLHKMNFKSDDGNIIPFWIEYYEQLGVEIPQGMQGSHPKQLLKQNHLYDKVQWL